MKIAQPLGECNVDVELHLDDFTVHFVRSHYDAHGVLTHKDRAKDGANNFFCAGMVPFRRYEDGLVVKPFAARHYTVPLEKAMLLLERMAALWILYAKEIAKDGVMRRTARSFSDRCQWIRKEENRAQVDQGT